MLLLDFDIEWIVPGTGNHDDWFRIAFSFTVACKIKYFDELEHFGLEEDEIN